MNLFKKKAKPILLKENIIIHHQPLTYREAIEKVGAMLKKSGYVTQKYVDGMFKRDEELSVYLGNLLAIPHGVFEVKDEILHSGICVMVVPNGIDWHGEEVKVVIGLAGKGEEHMQILSNISMIFAEIEEVEKLIKLQDPQQIYQLFNQ